ncbi:MAG: hypothetical protein AAGD13_08590 [Pseudomonadota bacterium]
MAQRIRFTTAAQVSGAFPAIVEDLGDLPEDVSPLDYIQRLVDEEDFITALFFTALALPKRDAVWWGCLALRGMGSSDPLTAEGLRLAEAWCRHPEEEERRAAGEFAQDNYFEGAGPWIAFAAFTTSGSMAPAGLQAVPPSAEVSGKAVAMSIMLATENEDVFVTIDNQKCAIASATDFAGNGDGTGPWKDRLQKMADAQGGSDA